MSFPEQCDGNLRRRLHEKTVTPPSAKEPKILTAYFAGLRVTESVIFE
jgi:hypothetical protein